MKTASKLLQVFCYHYFKNFLASVAFAKIFGFLACVVFKILAIENALATNRNVAIEIITFKKSIFE